MTELAIAKLNEESKAAKGLSSRANVMQPHITETLIAFCKQDTEFAQAILQSDKTLKDCCEVVANSVGNSISDLEAYTRAVQFYFPGAGIHFNMTINLCASVDGSVDKAEKQGQIALDLTSFF